MLASQAPRRVFLGWDRPVLVSAVDWLRGRVGDSPVWDLSGYSVVLSSARGGRRLVELLHGAAGAADCPLVPPEVLTLGQFPERVYRPSRPVASSLEQTLCWARVLQAMPAERLRPLVPMPPGRDQFAAWMELASLFRDLHEDLASEGWTFGDVTEQVPAGERPRWVVLAELQGAYHRRLGDSGRSDRYAERRAAIREQRCETQRRWVFLATADLNRVQRELIGAIHRQATVLVAAPESESGLVDALGVVRESAWEGRALPVRDDQLLSAGSPEDQARGAAGVLAEWGSEWAADEITIGVTDAGLVEPVRTELDLCGVRVRSEYGRSAADSPPARLLLLLRAMAVSPTYRNLAALVRHADVDAWLTGGGAVPEDYVAHLDRCIAEHFPGSIDDPLPAAASEAAGADCVRGLVERVRELLEPLAGRPRPLAAWARPLAGLLETIYGDVGTSGGTSGGTSRAALAILRQRLDRLAGLPESVDTPVAATTALDLLFSRLGERRLAEPPDAAAVELAGWLDLALDDAPALVVCGVNEGQVPESVGADAFLPGSLRTRLRVSDNARRYARDAFALELLVRTRPRLRLVVGRQDAEGNPLAPSRLLAACSSREAARRLLRLVEPNGPSVVVPTRWGDGLEATRLPIPPAAAAPPRLRSMSVTYFGDYLRCPYRFFLSRVLRLRPLDDRAGEMAANQFGELVHDTLERFGLEGPADSTDVGEVEAFLLDTVATLARERYGEALAAAVRLQVEQARARLRVVAERQAERARDGWRIVHCEASIEPKHGIGLDVDGDRMLLKGRIDRVDRHEPTGRWQVIDYKTHRHAPRSKHYDGRKRQWKELQLPLYRHLIRALEIDGCVELAYFNIAEKPSDTRMNPADFTAEELEDADRTAREVVRGIWGGRFEINPEAATPYDDFAVICQTGIVGNALAEFELEEADE